MGEDTDRILAGLPTGQREAVRAVVQAERGRAARVLRENLPLLGVAVTLASAIAGAWLSMQASVSRALDLGERGIAAAEETRRLLLGDPHDPGRPGLVVQVREHERVIAARLPVSIDIERRVGVLEGEVRTERASVGELRADIVRRLDRIEASNQAILERVARIEGRRSEGDR